jgi:hypothetical protein
MSREEQIEEIMDGGAGKSPGMGGGNPLAQMMGSGSTGLRGAGTPREMGDTARARPQFEG